MYCSSTLTAMSLCLMTLAVAPKVHRDSTILVTDIQDSTLMWELLSQEAMNQAVEVGHPFP